jgi:hypothetical protein
MSNREFKEALADHVSEGGISAIEKLIDMIDIDELKEEYGFLNDNGEKLEDEEEY